MGLTCSTVLFSFHSNLCSSCKNWEEDAKFFNWWRLWRIILLPQVVVQKRFLKIPQKSVLHVEIQNRSEAWSLDSEEKRVNWERWSLQSCDRTWQEFTSLCLSWFWANNWLCQRIPLLMQRWFITSCFTRWLKFFETSSPQVFNFLPIFCLILSEESSFPFLHASLIWSLWAW